MKFFFSFYGPSRAHKDSINYGLCRARYREYFVHLAVILVIDISAIPTDISDSLFYFSILRHIIYRNVTTNLLVSSSQVTV